MALITWPTYAIPSEPPVSVPVDIQNLSVNLRYPGRRTVKAQFTNKELVYDVSDGEFFGTVTLAGQNRNSPAHRAVITFLSELNDNPGERYTLLPWEKPSIYTVNSTFNASSPIHGNNNELVGSMTRIANSVGRLAAVPTSVGETISVTPGEHFGYGMKTYRIITATEVAGQPGVWDIQTAPELPNTATTAGGIYKRNHLPCRIVGGQNITDPTNGRFAGPWAFNIVEERVN